MDNDDFVVEVDDLFFCGVLLVELGLFGFEGCFFDEVQGDIVLAKGDGVV